MQRHALLCTWAQKAKRHNYCYLLCTTLIPRHNTQNYTFVMIDTMAPSNELLLLWYVSQAKFAWLCLFWCKDTLFFVTKHRRQKRHKFFCLLCTALMPIHKTHFCNDCHSGRQVTSCDCFGMSCKQNLLDFVHSDVYTLAYKVYVAKGDLLLSLRWWLL